MADDELVEMARDCRRLAAILRERCTVSSEVNEAFRRDMSSIVTDTVFDLRWILGRNYGSDTIAAEVETAARVVPEASVIVDVGANAGDWSRAALQMFPQARVIAFEPQRAHEDHLSAIRAEYSSRFEFDGIALSDAVGTAQLYSNEFGSGLTSLYQRDLQRFYNVDMKPTSSVTTSTLLDQSGRYHLREIDILKVDVEGHELAVLRGAQSFISNIKYIQFEFGGAMMDSKVSFRDFMSFFAELPFDIFRVSPIGLIAIPFYHEGLEGFEMSNYVAINRSMKPHTI
jgi:FkbM family methyltransferase